MSKPFITIVSGIPRSGTSMMMQVLEAGGIEALTDEIRKADEDNPKGYYEFERVKKIKEDKEWLGEAMGKVVKMIYALLYDMPLEGYEYRVVFMRRKLEESMKSQSIMLERSGRKGGGLSTEQMVEAFRKQLEKFDAWIAGKGCFKVLDVDYTAMIERPVEQCERINEFLGGDLNVEAMAGVVDPTLYRNRG
jgi:hypothetical protein